MTRRTAARSVAVAVAAAIAVPSLPAGADDGGVSVTVYSDPAAAGGGGGQPLFNPTTGAWEQPAQGFSIVRERRRVRLDDGRSTVRFDDVAARIDATTVRVRSLTDPAVRVLEQDFQFDLASADRILEKHIGRDVEVVAPGGATVPGRLLSFDAGQVVVQGPGGRVEILARGPNVANLRFGELPGGLTTRPTLVWRLQTPKGGDHVLDVSYETSGMSWAADYTAVVSADEARADLAAWVTIENRSGGTYRDARLKLIAGDVHRAPVAKDVWLGAARAAAEMAGDGAPDGFVEKAFFEYHLYTLGRPTTIADRSTKQIELFPAVTGAPCRKTYVYDGAGGTPYWTHAHPAMDDVYGPPSHRKVAVYLEIENRKDAGLGLPLPAGRVRVHKADDADGSLELVGEDRIDHTPADEKILLRLGNAFDLVGERRVTAFNVDHGARWMRESFEVSVRNRKTEPVDVRVRERLYRGLNWKIERASHEFVKQDARGGHFPVQVPAGGEVTVAYTVRYTW